jgi:hypothetical protein
MENNTVSSATKPVCQATGGVESPAVAMHPIATRAKITVSHETVIEHVRNMHLVWQKGDRDGVWHCPIPLGWVRGSIRTLVPGEILEAKVTFAPRRGVDEDPRIEVKAAAEPDSCSLADCILYSQNLMGKDSSNPSADFEIIAIRGLESVNGNPRPLITLLCNIFAQSGGTPVEGTAEQKLKMIEESFLFWRDKIMVE